MVISSRPLLVFEEAFVEEPHLRLQDLTADEIKVYVGDKLGSHPRMASLRMRTPEGAEGLASGVISKASGVFLWVRLVVESLLEGLTDGNGMEELHKTLDDLPEALEDLFRHMFRKIPQNYHAEASRIFQVVRRYQKKSDTWICGVLTVATLSFATERNTALDAETHIGPMDLGQISERYVRLERRLKSRCCGLIEIHDERNIYAQSGATLLGGSVQFIQKTVTDFLDDRTIWGTILTGSAENFDPNMALLNSYIMQLKHLDVPKFGDWCYQRKDSVRHDLTHNLIEAASTFAKQTTNTSIQVKLLHEMDRTVSFYRTRHLPNEPSHWCNYLDRDEGAIRETHGWYDSFLSFCIERGLCQDVAAQFNEHGKELIHKKGRPLLDYAVRPLHPYMTPKDPMIVKVLLDNGANPNEVYNGWSTWSNALYVFHRREGNERLAKMLELLVLYHADPNVTIEEVDTHRRWFKIRYSALRVLQCNIDKADGETLLIIQRVIKLLIDRGAKEREWHDGKLVHPRYRAAGYSLVSSWGSVRSGRVHPIDSLPTRSEKNLLHRVIQHVKGKRVDDPDNRRV